VHQEGIARQHKDDKMKKFQIIETGKIVEAREWELFIETANGDQYAYSEVRRV
jgi:hypothetical protein